MQRFLLSTLVCLFALVLRAERVDYFATDFSGGLPAGTLSIDRDQQTLHFTMVQAGFDQGDAWKAFTLNGRSYAASPGRHKTAKGETALPADDWMVLPAVRILAADAQLTWRAETMAESIEEGCTYEVRILARPTADDGYTPHPEDFTETPIATIDAETIGSWQTHTASLAPYAGREVWISFVHTSLNREILAVSDVAVSGSTGLYRLSDNTERYSYGPSARPIVKGSVEATSATPIKSFTAICETQGQTLTQRFEDVGLKAGDVPYAFAFELPRALAPGDAAHYALRVEVDDNDGVEQPAIEGSVQQMLFATTRRSVVEEGTGMWCGYCPRGIVAMREMRRRYPDTFIGIAVHYDDVLGTAVADYCSKLAFPSFPSAYVNRTTLCGDPMPQDAQGCFSISEGLERSFKVAMTDAAPADLLVAWTLRSDGRLALTADAHFAVTAYDTDYRLAAMVVEDEVSGSTYYQTNYYSGSNVPLGGFETEDKTIKPYTFDEVARGALLPFEGRAGDIPAHVEAGRHYTLTTDIKAPTIGNLQHSRVVLMLLDARSGEVVNAVQAAPLSQADYNAFLTGVSLTPTLPHSSAPAYGLDGRRFDANAAASSLSGRRVSIEDGKKHLR